MGLSVPQRHEADASSFPTEPEAVARWLETLDPLKVSADARELLRGLRHSNRLNNSVSRRRSVLARFHPVLRALENQLMAVCQAQCLPLTDDFRRSLQLLESLLREENLALKILLDESPKPDADDLRRALQTLVKQTELAILSYRPLQATVLAEADVLFRLAESQGLLQSDSDPVLPSSARLYAYLKLLSLADTHAERTRQLPLLLAFVKRHASEVVISPFRGQRDSAQTLFVWQPDRGARPVPPDSLPQGFKPPLYQLDLQSFLARLDEEIARAQTSTSFLLGADVLERQSLERLRSALRRNRPRRASRAVRREGAQLVFGHRAICASVRYQASNPDDNEAHAAWTLVDETRLGAALQTNSARVGSVQVGELVAVRALDVTARGESPSSPLFADRLLIAVTRRVVSVDDSCLQIGIEYLCADPLALSVTRPTREQDVADYALLTDGSLDGAPNAALLVAAFRYRSGDCLLLHDQGRTVEANLGECLSSNGLFSQYRLDPPVQIELE